MATGADRKAWPALAYNLARNEYLVTYDNAYLGGTNNENVYVKRLTGDGVVLGGELNVAFGAVGTHMVRLQVCDTGGLTATVTRQVTVGEQRFVALPLILR
ncbi:MAG: hypothetical protein R6X31_10045 [Anaerolineae bacterium]